MCIRDRFYTEGGLQRWGQTSVHSGSGGARPNSPDRSQLHFNTVNAGRESLRYRFTATSPLSTLASSSWILHIGLCIQVLVNHSQLCCVYRRVLRHLKFMFRPVPLSDCPRIYCYHNHNQQWFCSKTGFSWISLSRPALSHGTLQINGQKSRHNVSPPHHRYLPAMSLKSHCSVIYHNVECLSLIHI